MRHRVADKKFNRDANARKALFNGLLRNLAEHGEVVTTVAKAKVIKRLADKLVTQAKVDTLASRRILHRVFGKRDVVNTLVERIAPALGDRNSGYTRITVLGNRRGDNTPMAKLAFVNMPENMGSLKSGKEYPEVTKKPVAQKVAAKPVAKAAVKAVKAPAATKTPAKPKKTKEVK